MSCKYPNNPQTNPKIQIMEIIRLATVKEKTGLARSTLYLRIQQGLLTKPVSLGGKAVGITHCPRNFSN